MRRSKHLIIAFILLFPSLAVSEDLGLARLSLIEGNVQIISEDDDYWAPAAFNMPLSEGDRLWVPENSRLEIQLRGGVYLRADERSSIDLLSLGGDAMQIYMDRGHLYINNRRGGIQTVQIDTPQSSIRSDDRVIMLLDVEEDSTTALQSLRGYVYLENREGKTRIASGSALTIRPDGNAELAPLGTPDAWETWNRELDMQRMAGGDSSRYLPDALKEYASDFDRNGRWVYSGEFGYIWSPSVITAAWAPYRDGRWQWMRGRYVWISHESWGWAPYHYGRWAYVAGTGWCWIPPPIDDIYWGPGYVGWVNTPEYIGWVPLAPGEIYYGYGYYGPRSVNIATISVHTIVVKPFRNAPMHNSVTMVKHETFGTPRPILLKPKGDPFLKQRGDFFPPIIKQAKPLPVQRRGMEPATKQPPERIQRIKPAEIKTERKLVKEREASVFKHTSQKPLPLKKLTEPKVIKRTSKTTERQEKKKQPQKKTSSGDEKKKKSTKEKKEENESTKESAPGKGAGKFNQ